MEGMYDLKLILVVDDNIVNLKQVNSQLSDSYRMMLAKSGEQALKMCEQERPDLILLDIEMPGMDGFETIARLKQDAELSRIPVVFLTANHDTEVEVRGLQSGAMDFITKPFEKSILSHRIDLHLRYSEYQQNLEDTVKELENNIVTSFSEIVECRDENTGGHVVRTSRYADILGKQLQRMNLFEDQLTDSELEMIVRASPMHDVGKIGISDIVLLKPGKLDDDEFSIIKTHTTIGADIIRSMYAKAPTQEYLKHAIMIAEGHHEKFNGKGYPDGKAGEDIPLCARIMAVADVYDALVDNRVYRRAMSHDDACNIILEGKGSHFDPRIVDAFVSVNGMMAAESQRKA
jgi:putative two-component system response regulator